MADDVLAASSGPGIPVRRPARSPLAAFREAAKAGQVAVATGIGRASFPPRFTNPSGQIEAGTDAGEGIVYSATRVERRGDPYILALIDLAGGGRLLAQVLADDAAALIGRAVRLVEDGQPFLTFAVAPPEDVP